MGKRIRLLILACLCLLWVWTAPALADAGPKPSVVVDFRGLEGETYFATLLSETDSTGPWSVEQFYSDWQGPESVWEAFTAYGAEDGYYFLSFYQDCTTEHRLAWTYYPPARFKILLYFPERDCFLVSPAVYERYAFDSYYQAAVDWDPANPAGSAMTVTCTYDWSWQALSLLCRILLTIGMELALAWVFGFRRRRQVRVVLLTNVATQVLLNVALNLIAYHLGAFAFVFHYIWMEILILLLEGLVYRRLLTRDWNRTGRPHPWLYAIAANIASFVLGLLIANWLPGIF